MKALVLDGPDRVSLRSVSTPALTRDDEVLVRVRATGICGTDLLILSGRYQAKPGIILGHETTGVVEQIGSAVTRFQIGHRVILDPTYHCSNCFYCNSNRPNYCEKKSTTETGVVHDGTFAEFHVAHEQFLHHLPDELTFEQGTLTEPLACSLHALSHTRLRIDSRILILGGGPMGLLFTAALIATGHDVTLGEVEPYRLSQGRQFTAQVRDLRQEPLNAGDGRFDLIIDTTGRMLEAALPFVHRGGEVLLIGLDHDYEARIHPAYLTDNGIRLVGSIDTNRTFAPAISLLQRHPQFGRIITHAIPLVEYESALQLLGVSTQSRMRSEIRANKIVLLP
jgi:threonine dehydrogenase-like Zn-dependent dehydrogenase